LHGDLHPYNLVVHEGRIAAVIDFGDITAGDPATDLGIAWMLLPPDVRPVLRDAVGVDDATWARGRGWALGLGLAYLANSASTPAFARLGLATIDAVLADEPA
jgi:aminoglycoside phosphotransferase (APT) family kinase protein